MMLTSITKWQNNYVSRGDIIKGIKGKLLAPYTYNNNGEDVLRNAFSTSLKSVMTRLSNVLLPVKTEDLKTALVLGQFYIIW